MDYKEIEKIILEQFGDYRGNVETGLFGVLITGVPIQLDASKKEIYVFQKDAPLSIDFFNEVNGLLNKIDW